MKVKRPGSPLSGAAEAIDAPTSKEIQKAIKGERFADALAQLEAGITSTGAQGTSGGANASGAQAGTRAALAEIAAAANLSTSEGVASAVRESARFIVRGRLGESQRDTEVGERLTEELSEYVADDPLLKSKIFRILQHIKAA